MENLKYKQIQAFTPEYHSRLEEINKVYVIRALKGPTRKSDINEMSVAAIFKLNKNIDWKHVVIGSMDGNLYMYPGNKDNGFTISSNATISNKKLVSDIFEFYKFEKPQIEGLMKRIWLKFEFVDKEMIKLTLHDIDVKS
jgi:hypothetical protein